MHRRLWLITLSAVLMTVLSLTTLTGCGDSQKKPTAEMPKEKPNLGQPLPPPQIPPPPK